MKDGLDGLIHKIALLCKDFYVNRTIDDLFLTSGAKREWYGGEQDVEHSFGSSRMSNVYGWVDGIKENASSKFIQIIAEVTEQIASNEDVPIGERDFLRRYLSKVMSSQDILVLNDVEKASLNSFHSLQAHIKRIHVALNNDPELAVGSTKEMVESVLKVIIEGFGEEVENDDLPKLLRRVQGLLNLSPSEVDDAVKGADVVRRTLSNLGQIVSGIAELRNVYGTGHGRTRQSAITPRHARLVVGAGATLATFLMETYELQRNASNGQ